MSLEHLEKKVALLSDMVLQIEKNEMARLTNEVNDSAAFEALFSMVRELAEHEGISEAEFQRHFDMRFRYWLEDNLRRAEDISPNLAGEIDKRPIADCATDDTYPPLFPTPPA